MINDTLTMSCSQPALRLVTDSTDSLPRGDRLTSKRHSLKMLPFGSGPLGPRAVNQSTQHSGVILQRKDIFYSGSLMKIPTELISSQAQLDTLTNDDVPDASTTSAWAEFMKVFKTMMDLSLLKDPIFLFFAFSNFFTSIGYNVPYIYLVVSPISTSYNLFNAIYTLSNNNKVV